MLFLLRWLWLCRRMCLWFWLWRFLLLWAFALGAFAVVLASKPLPHRKGESQYICIQLEETSLQGVPHGDHQLLGIMMLSTQSRTFI